MAARRGEARRKKRLGAFFAFDEALESLVSIPSTHTLMSPESQDITARTPESDLGKKTASIFQKNDHGRYDKYVTHNEVCNLLESFGKLSS